MSEFRADVLDWIDSAYSAPEKFDDVLAVFPDLTVDEACYTQLERNRRRIAAGDKMIGYKLALTSKAMQEKAGSDHPRWGAVFASTLFADKQHVNIGHHLETRLEPEIAVFMARDLKGPGVTMHDVLGAVGTCAPMIEMNDQRAKSFKRSEQLSQLCNAFNWGQIVGGRRTPVAGMDLRHEGMVMSVNGEMKATAAAAEVLGHPLNAVIYLANRLADFGLGLEAGMMVQTGSVGANLLGQVGDHVQVTFTRIGSVDLYLDGS